jgi:predicted negative regulator of RcsB-dependent stress response
LSRCLLGSFVLSSLLLCAHAQTQTQTGSQSSSSSSSIESTPDTPTPANTRTKAPARIAQPEAGGSAITLETSEPLFYLAAALNTCGYDADLAASAPVRRKIREEINAEVASSSAARTSRDALCGYIRLHTLNDSGLNLAQYISLALYLTPPPALTPTADETELPPDANQVVNILPLLRTFAEDIHLNAIWGEHRAEYEALVNHVHDPLTKMVLNTNIYLRLPVSSYDGRRFLVLLEPMLAPSSTNARIYASDYIVVASPAGEPVGAVHMDDIRHIYLHYEIEPLVYARASAMERLTPLLKAVHDAPLEFTYKSEIVPLITECLIKAIEAHTMDVGIPKPQRPTVVRERTDMERFDAENTAYEHQAEAARRKALDLDMRQGWILAGYFYDQITQMEKDSISLKEDIGQMVYGMDVDRERKMARDIAFLPQGTHDVLNQSRAQLTGLQLAEMKMYKGDLPGASEIANKVLSDPTGDHAQAHYVLARVNLMQRQPGAAIGDFQQVLDTSKDPRTLAWSHIYLGRLYDVNQERQKAVAEYQAALVVRDAQPDTKAAAEKGIKEPFAAPKVEHAAQPNASKPDDDDAPLDPSGKAEKEAYRPPPPQ